MNRRLGQGRKRKTSQRDDRFLRLTVLRSRHCTAKMLQKEILAARDVVLSTQTVRNRLREVGMRPKVPVKAPLLTRAHKVTRLKFALNHQHWNVEDWSNILFADESRFCLYSSDRRMPMYRRPGKRYLPINILPQVNFGGSSIMFWGGISYTGHTELVALPGARLTTTRYITDVLESHVMPYGA